MKPWIDTFNDKHTPGPTSGCWLWTGAVGSGTYGTMTRNIKGGKSLYKLAHRFSWERHNGPIPEGLCVLHKCDVRTCVNPGHLFLGTQKDNLHDMHKKGRDIPPAGSRNSHAKIAEKDVRYIRNSEGSDKDISDKFGIQTQTVKRIRNKLSWRHVA